MTNAPSDSPDALAATIRGRAAVVGTFDPAQLLAQVAPALDDEAVEDRIFSTLSSSVEEVLVGKDVLWRLHPEARRRTLEALAEKGELDRTIALAKPRSGDRFGQILQATLKTLPKRTKRDPSMHLTSTDDLTLQALALDFARSLPGARSAILQEPSTDPRILLARQAERRRQDYVAPGKLFGRDRDAEALDRYLADGFVGPPLTRLDAPPDARPRLRPLLVTGIGGSGKSALVADLMRRTQREDWSGPIVVGLDFDQKSIALGGEREWLNELTRQIGVARPKLDEALWNVRSGARRHLHDLTREGKDVEHLTGTESLDVVSTMRENFRSVLSSDALASETLVVVIDTFEEVLVRSDMRAEAIDQEPFGLLMAFVDALNDLVTPGPAAFAAIRAIVASRAHPFPDQEFRSAHWFEAHLEVGELNVDAAAEFLRIRTNRRVITKVRARKIVEQLPRFPLILILLANFARDKKASEIDEIVDGSQGSGALSAEAFVRVLYSRFLDRLKDHTLRDGTGERVVLREDLTRLAHPGLALSVVTPELIRHVLAGPTGLGDIDDQRARDLFEALSREVWLVERVGVDAVRHVPVLRRIMLPMLTGDLTKTENADLTMRETVRAVHRAAAMWYRSAGANAPGAFALAAYHDAFLGEISNLASDPNLCRLVLDVAGEDIFAMPIEARALLRREAGTDEALSTLEAVSFSVEESVKVEASRRSKRTKRGVTSRQTDVAEAADRGALPFESSGATDEESATHRDVKALPSRSVRRDQLRILQDGETADLIEGSFAEADFEKILSIGSRSAAALRDNAEDDPPFESLGDCTSHWTWKWALSCLAMGAGDESLLKWAAARTQPVNAPSKSSPFRIGTVITLAVATVALGRAPSFVEEQPYRDAVSTYPVFESSPVNSLLSLRLRALARYWEEDLDQTRPKVIEVRPQFLRLVELWMRVRDTDRHAASPSSHTGSSSSSSNRYTGIFPWSGPDGATRSIRRGDRSGKVQMPEDVWGRLRGYELRPFRSSDLRILDENEGTILISEINSISWWASPSEASRSLGAGRSLIPARSPELYDPTRAALGDVAATDPSGFADAIKEIKKIAPFWPTDLQDSEFIRNANRLREVDYFLARLVIFLDLADLSSQFLSAVARRTKVGKRFGNVEILVRRYDSLLNGVKSVS